MLSAQANTKRKYGARLSWHSPAAIGGKGALSVSSTLNGKAETVSWIVYMDGASIPASNIASRLVSLNSKGARTHLLTGIAMRESSYQQFVNRNLYLVRGYCPLDSSSDGGSHVGLMQMPNGMAHAFDWLANTSDAYNLFQQKLNSFKRYVAGQRKTRPTLRDLSGIEYENDALVLYGPYAVSGHYYVPNVAGTDWVVNTVGNANGVNYANSVVSLMQ